MLKNDLSSGPLAIWSITPNGRRLGEKIQKSISDSVHFVSARLCKDNPAEATHIIKKTLSKEIHHQFNRFQGHIFLFSTGIAVRIIAPLLNSKLVDPAVVVIDDNGKHAISLISGHIGGANHLAQKTASIIDATPVITTATDTNLLPAIDMIAKENGLFIETPQNIKHINMAFLMGEKVGVYDPFGFIKNNLSTSFWADKNAKDNNIFCSQDIKSVSRETLVLRPPVLSVGIGCNKGTPCEDIKQMLLSVLKAEGLSVNGVFKFATTIVKKDEAGLLALSDEMSIPLDFYSKDELNSVKTIKTPSKMVEKHLGVKSVCEAAAILSADNGKLIVHKEKSKDVTIAVAIKK